MRGAIYLALAVVVAACGFSPRAAAEPVATLEKTDGTAVTAEFITISGGRVWVRRLSADRQADTIPLGSVRAIDFDEIPIELNADGAILLDPQKPDDLSPLWWAVNNRQFIVLLRTCRLDEGTARVTTVLKMAKEISDRLDQQDIAPNQRRDLEIAHIVILSACGRGEEVREGLARLRRIYRDDPQRLRFVDELIIMIQQERRDRRTLEDKSAVPPAPPETPRREERRNAPRPPVNP